MNHYKCRITLVGSRAGRQYHDDWRTNRIWRRNNISQLLRLHVILFILRRIYMRERGMGRAPFNCRPAASVGGCLCCWALVISGNHYTVPMPVVHNVAWHEFSPLFRILLEAEESNGQGHLAARVVNVTARATNSPPSFPHLDTTDFRKYVVNGV